VTALQVLERLLMLLDGRLELFDVFGAAFTESGLGLAIALFAFLGGGIDLASSGQQCFGHWERRKGWGVELGGQLTGLRPPLRFCCCWGLSWVYAAGSGSGDEAVDDVEPSRKGSILPT